MTTTQDAAGAPAVPVDAPPVIATFGGKAFGKTTDALTVVAGNGLIFAQPGATIVSKTVLGVDINSRIQPVDCFERLPDAIYAAKSQGFDAVYIDDGTLLMQRSMQLAMQRFKKGSGYDFAMYTYLRGLVTNVVVALRWCRIPGVITCHDQDAQTARDGTEFPLGPDLGWSKLVHILPRTADVSQHAIGRGGAAAGPGMVPGVGSAPPVPPPAVAVPAPAPAAPEAPPVPGAAPPVPTADGEAAPKATAPTPPAVPPRAAGPRPAWDFRVNCPRGRRGIATGDRFDVLPEWDAPLNSLMLIREAARVTGYNYHVPRPRGLEWMDEVAEDIAGALVDGQPRAQATKRWIDHLKKAGIHPLHIRWAVRDGIHLSELRAHREDALFAGML